MRQGNFEFMIPKSFFQRTAQARLTTRETEVVERLACGESYKIVADALGISENTVDNHVQRIHLKLGFSSTMQCVLFLLQKSPR
jgi:DNA-binding NarL/FixJ family response regulator